MVKEQRRRLPAIVAATAAAVLIAELYVVFINRESAFAIHGDQEYAVAEFAARRPVRHAFLMNGDGLTSVSVLVSGDRGARMTLKWVLWRGMPDAPATMAVVAEGQDTFDLRGPREWRTYPMIRDGSSHDRWYTVEITMIDLAPSDAAVQLIGSHDNPDRGGVLWADGTRQAGSLVLRANRVGRTPYQRFRLEAARHLPELLQREAVQLILVAGYHLAFLTLAYAFVKAADQAPAPPAPDHRPYVAVVSLQRDDATTTLFFQHLRQRTGAPLRIVQYPSRELAPVLAGASAIIVVRALFECPAVMRFAARFNVPLGYFLDDNFITLRDAGGPGAKFYERYSLDAVRSTLQRFSTVLLATAPLADYFRTHHLHSSLTTFGPTVGPKHEGRPGEARLGIAFFGGSHLHEVFREHVHPAIQRLARTRAVRLIAAGADEIAPAEGLEVVRLPYFPSYGAGVAALAREGVDVLVHPVVESGNSHYKNPHALITAATLGAVPVVSRRAPYTSVDPGVAVLADDGADAWLAALELVSDRARRESMAAHLDEYCRAAFDGAANAAHLEAWLGESATPGPVGRWWRSMAARAFVVSARLRGRIGLR